MKNGIRVFDETVNWLKEQAIDFKSFASVDSTNNVAKKDTAGVNLKVFVADEQTAGRGRGQNTWSDSKSQSALMITWSFFLKEPPQPISGPLLGLALYKAFHTAWPDVHLHMKAPNDIYLFGKKVCGILTELLNVEGGFRLIIGVGANILACPQLPTATHLSAHTDVDINSWQKFLTSLYSELNLATQKCTDSHLSDEHRERILKALNADEKQIEPFIAVSPFGDLVTAKKTISWRDL